MAPNTLLRNHCKIGVFQTTFVLQLDWSDLGWPLLTGGRCSEVVVNTGLTEV
jgi:hypothetical protein